MTDTWDGRPQNPERDGWHWLEANGNVIPAEWSSATDEDTPWCIGECWFSREFIGTKLAYLGPCLTPAEIERLRAALKQAEEGLREAGAVYGADAVRAALGEAG